MFYSQYYSTETSTYVTSKIPSYILNIRWGGIDLYYGIILHKLLHARISTGELDTEGYSVVFLSRDRTRIGDAIKFRSNDNYIEEEFSDVG